MARNLKNLTGMPQIVSALSGWESVILLTRVTQLLVDGDKTETFEDLIFQGTVQPLIAQELKLKPEGLRSFKWLMIHCHLGNLSLNTDDKIVYNNEDFIVMGIKDYSLNNFMEYHLIEAYE